MRLIILTEEVPGPAIARVGDILEVQLEESPATGYQWRVYEPAILTPSSNELVLARDLPGAAHVRVVRFVARTSGTADVVCSLQREWDVEPLREFACQVVVRP